MRNLKSFAAALAAPVLIACAAPAGAYVVPITPGKTDVDTIRELRLQYNRAIQARDPKAMAAFMSPTFTEMVTNGAVNRGIDAVVQDYVAVEFKDPNFIMYDRQPDTVEVGPGGRRAVERGHWQGRFRSPDGKEVGASGMYQAGWILMENGWRLQTESYVQLVCYPKPDCS